MAQYIDKDALIAEIERRKQWHEEMENGWASSDHFWEKREDDEILYFIDTIEVKEVDLKEEVERFAKECGYKSAATIDFQFAKHFFELGLSVSNSTKVTAPHRTKADVDVAMAEIEEKSKAFTETHKCETAEEILAQMRGEEPVSNDLEEEIRKYQKEVYDRDTTVRDVARHFANWQKQQMMKDATEVTVHIEAGKYPYIPQIELYDYDKDMPLAKEGEKYKVILIKED